MTFNVRAARFADGENIWPNRAALSAEVIRRHAPDLIGFQELDLVNYAFYLRHLPGYEHALGPGYNNSAPFQYPAIFWRRDRLRVRESGGFWLSTTPQIHSRAWETDCIRSAAWVRLELRDSGRQLIHLNTHLDHVSEPARANGAALIAARLQELWRDGAPAVVTGDFNCVPGSPAHAALLASGLADAHTAVHGDTGPVMTFHGFHGRAFEPQGFDARDRIDWVLARGLRPVASIVVEDAAPPIYPSDHYPVVVDLAAD
jgi:endonuclease/exonuclease/phosphatase family metal-dependent hydrolase